MPFLNNTIMFHRHTPEAVRANTFKQTKISTLELHPDHTVLIIPKISSGGRFSVCSTPIKHVLKINSSKQNQEWSGGLEYYWYMCLTPAWPTQDSLVWKVKRERSRTVSAHFLALSSTCSRRTDVVVSGPVKREDNSLIHSQEYKTMTTGLEKHRQDTKVLHSWLPL